LAYRAREIAFGAKLFLVGILFGVLPMVWLDLVCWCFHLIGPNSPSRDEGYVSVNLNCENL
jgi:hypothetical protein